MELKTYNINSTFDKMSLIHNMPIQFSVNDRRIIEFKLPSVKDTMGDLKFKTFLGIISLTPEKISEKKITFNFLIEKHGDLIQGLIGDNDYTGLIVPYLLKYITGSEYKENAIYVNDEKVMSYELDYIVDKILISLGQKPFEEEVKQAEQTNPEIAKILKAQKEAEEKLRKVKQKRFDGKLTTEEIILSIVYEFGVSPEYLLSLTYYSIIWYFGYVGKVDAHKLNQLILSSGMSKQKNYNYWLNK